jgi:hypothetical protein
MITLLPIYQNERNRTPRRESEKDLLMRAAREHKLEERREKRRAAVRRITGLRRRAA